MKKHIIFYIFIFLFVSIFLTSCHYVERYSYIEGAKIERNDYTLEYVSLNYKEDVIIDLKITKKTTNEIKFKSAISRSPLGSYKEEPKEIYFNDILQDGKENISLTSDVTNIKLIYPIEVKNGTFDLFISDESFNMWIKSKEYLFGTTTTNQAS